MNKIKEIAYSVLIITAIVFLGFSPAAPALFALAWGDLGAKLVEAGAIDENKFPDFYDDKQLKINSENSAIALNTLWAFGLANKNPVLEHGPMVDPRYGDPGNFASTGGWTLSKGNVMDHYSMHRLVTLTPEQQALLEKVAKNIYRPCCQNSTYFPDCNHGMAMLGLLELMAAQGASEEEMNKTAEEVNALWFPELNEKKENGPGCSV